MSDDKIKRAREMHLDEQPLDAISRTLEVSLEWLRGALGLDSDVTVAAKPERPAPKPGKTDGEIEAEVVARLNAELRDRVNGPGYRVAPGGGKLRDGRPAPADLAELHEHDRRVAARGRSCGLGGL